jgi:hypothetical protein
MDDARQKPSTGSWIALAALTLVFAWSVGIRPGGGLYSSDTRYRVQTDAMFRGTLALQPVPQGQRADWAWGIGSQQVWGLGVPFLRMPGEVLARVIGQPSFPDRITLVALFAIVLFVATRAFDDVDPITRVAIQSVIGFLPMFAALSRTRLFVYEEAVEFAYLWAALQFVVVAGAERHKSSMWLWAAAAIAGVGAHIRPTLFLYGVVTMLVAGAIVYRRRDLKAAIIATAIFAAGVGTVLWTNTLRFDHALEFGQRVNSSRWVLDQYAKTFDYPYAHLPLINAGRELLAALSGVGIHFNGVDFYGSGPAMHLWFDPTVRFREFYFTSGATWIVIALAVVGWFTGGPAFTRATASKPMVLRAWSIISFVMMTAFYIRMPTMTSRYTVDFAAAITAGVCALLLSLSVERRKMGVAAIGLILSYGFLTVSVSPTHAAVPLVSQAEAARATPAPITSGPPIPSAYRCGDAIDQVGVPFNGVGWNWSGDCSLDAGTTLFLSWPDGSKCVQLELRGASPEDESVIEIAAGPIRLVRRPGSPRIFCGPEGFRPNPTGVEIMSFKWVAADRLSPNSKAGFGLFSVQTMR